LPPLYASLARALGTRSRPSIYNDAPQQGSGRSSGNWSPSLAGAAPDSIMASTSPRGRRNCRLSSAVLHSAVTAARAPRLYERPPRAVEIEVRGD
jgi:hypothetical protein